MSQSTDALLVRIDREWNTIRGRMLGLIESWGLPTTQELGAKSSFKALSSDAQARMAALAGDDGLRQQMTAVADAITELGECQALVDSEIAVTDVDERDLMRHTQAFLAQRLETLRDHQEDLQRLERIQRTLGGAR